MAPPSVTAHAQANTVPEQTRPEVKIQIRLLSGPDRYTHDPFPGFQVGFFQLCPKSRGWLHANCTDPFADPTIEPNDLTHPDDSQAMLREVVAYAKANPGTLNYGSVGIGTLEHLWVTLFSKTAGIEMTHVPFKGMPDAMKALVRGDLDFVPAVAPHAAPFVEPDKLREFGVISDKRLKSRPDLPTIKEQGFDVPPFEFWSGYAVPAATPAVIVEKLHTDLVAVLHEKDVVEKYGNLSTTIDTSDKPSDFAKVIAADLDWMTKTAEANKIKLG